MSSVVVETDNGLPTRAKRLFDWYALGRSRDLPKENREAALFWAIVAPLACGTFLGWMAFYLIYDAASLWPAGLACASFQCGLIAPWIARRSRLAAEIYTSSATAAAFSALMWIFGAPSGLTYGLLIGVLLLTMEIGTQRYAALILCATPLLALFWGLPIWFPSPQPFTNATPWLLDTIRFSNVATVIILPLIMLLLILRRSEDAEKALAKEHDRSEALLASLLPAQIVARLKDQPGAVIADQNPEVTILFADIVGFTQKAASMSPEALVTYLNRIFTAFDDLTARHGLEKIKTIGDAYMVAAGMPTPRADHAQAAAAMALDMLAATDRLSVETGEAVQVRIGLHSGPAVAGVIGTTKVFYDVWGDTVNTAARMESHGEAGRIQITEGTRAALGDTFDFAPRGVVEVKGKGPVEAFWLTGRAG